MIFCTKRDFRSIFISQTRCINLDPILKPRLCFEMFLLKVEDSLNVADILCLAWNSYYLRLPTNAALPSSYKCMAAVSGILKRSLIFTYFSDISASPSPSVTWLDNYSHIYHKTVTKVSQADYRSQMWTAEARCLFMNSNHNIDFTVKHLDGKVVPIMPADMFSYDDLSMAMKLASAATLRFSYERASCVVWNIKTTPPKPDLRKLSEQQRQHALTQSQFMLRFVPVALLDYNIGSNAGLSRCMREFYDKVTTPPQDQNYHVLLSDVAIFERVLKVACPYSCFTPFTCFWTLVDFILFVVLGYV